jgi:hypothetical protein
MKPSQQLCCVFRSYLKKKGLLRSRSSAFEALYKGSSFSGEKLVAVPQERLFYCM